MCKHTFYRRARTLLSIKAMSRSDHWVSPNFTCYQKVLFNFFRTFYDNYLVRQGRSIPLRKRPTQKFTQSESNSSLSISTRSHQPCFNVSTGSFQFPTLSEMPNDWGFFGNILLQAHFWSHSLWITLHMRTTSLRLWNPFPPPVAFFDFEFRYPVFHIILERPPRGVGRLYHIVILTYGYQD